MVHYDEILKHVGEFGTYQKRMCFFAFLPSLSVGMHMLAMAFLAATPEHRCTAPEAELLAARYNWTEAELLNMTIPWTKDDEGSWVRDSCKRYDLMTVDLNDSYGNRSGWNVTSCDAGWTYDLSQYKTSITQENDIVCSDMWLGSMAQSIYMLGVLIGSITFGDLSDRFGRKVVMFVANALLLIAGVSTTFAPNFTAFVILRFLVGLQCMGVYLVNFVLAAEIVGPSRRTMVGTLDYVFFVLGYMVMGGIAYLIRTWRHLQLAISLSGILWIPLWCVVTESPRWLLAKGRTEEAREIVEKMAKTNGTDFPRALWEKMVESKDKLEETPENDQFYSAWDLLRSPNLAKKSAIIFYNWAVINVVYYGLSLNTSALGGDDYISFFLSGLIEFPALLMSILVIEKWGRRLPHVLFMVGGGVACICTVFVPSDLFPLTMTLAMIGKFGISAGFNIIFIWTGEIYPTVISPADRHLEAPPLYRVRRAVCDWWNPVSDAAGDSGDPPPTNIGGSRGLWKSGILTVSSRQTWGGA
ncbi:SLC22A3 [Branchiostoma lanceolatum]|uniref:SLC22A3 protein n=1 Tax=Branchiostoma lanceolatum TaxID=7740 RepID=A0A8J9VXP1_BRALA|nr:SLC22A3 [Branchiostoma lanceolatum]